MPMPATCLHLWAIRAAHYPDRRTCLPAPLHSMTLHWNKATTHLRSALGGRVTAEPRLINVRHVQAHEPRADADILIGISVQDRGVTSDVAGDGTRQSVDLTAGVPHVVDAALARWVPESPVLRLEPFIPSICQDLTRLHAALHADGRWNILRKAASRQPCSANVI